MKKHLFLFILTLAVLSVSNVWADCTNSMSLDVKMARVIPSACSCGAPGNLGENANYYGYAGFFWDWKNSTGELYYMVTLPASTYSISISIANTKNAWMNIYSTTYSGNGSCTVGGVTYYKQSWHDMDNAHGEYMEYFNTETASSISLSAGTYVIGIYGEHYTAISELTITAASDVFCDCTAPNHVDVTATRDNYTPGQTISFTATAYSSAGTGSPITSDITYQWQKYTGSAWEDIDDDTNISGATTTNLQISNCTTSNGGSYRCVATVGESCYKESSDYYIRVWTFEGNYSGSGFASHSITWTSSTEGYVNVDLNGSSTYQFKVYDNGGKYFGCNSSISADASSWTFRTSDGNCSLSTGAVGGTFTFSFNVANVGGNTILVSVAYPRKRIYMRPSSNWQEANAVFFIKSWGMADQVAKLAQLSSCDAGVYYADIYASNTSCLFTRQDPNYASNIIYKNNTGNWAQSDDITISTNNSFSNTDWGTSFTGGSFSPTTYTITFNKNGADGGSDMSDVENIE